MSRTDPQLKVRLPLEMKEQLEAAAKENHRSMNAEIVARLEESLSSEAIESGWQSPIENDEDHLLGDAKQILGELDGVMKKYQRLQQLRARIARIESDNKGEE